jgi:hypothetical protein
MKDRPTADLVVIFLTGIVGVTVLITTIAVMYTEVRNPNVDTTRAVARIATIISSLITAIVGYIAGKKNGNGNGNGHS